MALAYLITGANRGIGLELVRQLTEGRNMVVATARDTGGAGELNDLAGRVEPLDVTDADSCAALGEALTHVPIDVLINNAGVGPEHGGIASLSGDGVRDHLDTNAAGPVRVTRAVLPSLRKGGAKRIINMSSQLGSIEGNAGGDYYAYRMGKAALNMFSVTLARELGPEGFTCISLHPGWVRTRMGGEQAPVSPETAASGAIDVIEHLAESNNGGFFDYRGQAVPW